MSKEVDFIAGQVPAWDGYESETSPQMLTITHNLLYDFSEPGYFTGAGASYTSGILTVQTLLGNSWNTAYTGSAAPTKAPTFEYRVSLAPSSALSFGLYGTIGKNPTLTNPGVETTRIYNDFDGTYTLGAATFNWQWGIVIAERLPHLSTGQAATPQKIKRQGKNNRAIAGAGPYDNLPKETIS